LKEHHRNIRLEHPEKLAVVEHSMNLRHRIQLHNSILSTTPGYTDRIITKAIEIELHPNNIVKYLMKAGIVEKERTSIAG
jgi:hypothetical protein